MKPIFRTLRLFLLLCMVFWQLSTTARAQIELPPNSSYEVATVTSIADEQVIVIDGENYYVQQVEVTLKKSGEARLVLAGSEFQPLSEQQRWKVGSQVVVSQQPLAENESVYVLNDFYRLPILVTLMLGFLVLVAAIGNKQGVLSVLGMLLSLAVLISFIIPHILAGENPFFVTLVGAVFTAVISMYISHGIKRQTHIALLSLLMCLAVAAILSTAVVHFGNFVGFGSEDAVFLQFGTNQKIHLKGLLLAGILLGTLGILDDITLAQTAVIEQLKAVHPKITFTELYWRGLTVGKDHVASLVNTLVFAYAGTSLPLFLLFTANRTEPIWVILNSQVIAEEVIRTVIGSIALVLAVPITTLLAAYFVDKAPPSREKNTAHFHHH